MGCSSSTSADPNNNAKDSTKSSPQKVVSPARSPAKGSGGRGDNSDLRSEPNIEDVAVTRTEPGYPPARPCKDKKADIFDANKMARIDQHAKQTPIEKTGTFEQLVAHLKSVCKTDLETLRAVFVWLCSQQVENESYSDVTDSDTPRGYLKLLRDRRLTYASCFAVLCRKAGLSCIVVTGSSKHAAYEVGMSDDEVRSLGGSWNLVHVLGGWRIVYPNWACRAVVGHSTGAYTKVESKGKAVREKEVESSGQTVFHLDEYYFLTDPEQFIYVALPQEPRYQLLPRPWSLQKFAEVPYCREPFFAERVQITGRESGRLTTVDGECHVELTCEKPADMSMDYELYYNHKESGREISSSLQLNNYVFLNRTPTTWNFGIRFPETGIYKLQIDGGHNRDRVLCYFRITCNEVLEDCQPFPVNPGKVGYGPSQDAELAGVVATSHKNGLVKVTALKQTEFSFNLTRSVAMKAELVHHTIPTEELQRYIKHKQVNRKFTVQVTVPEQGEYALQMHAQQKGESSYKNVCNYLLTSNEGKKKKLRAWENPIEKRTRNTMQNLSKAKGTRQVEDLEKAIQTFEKLDMDDKGDLAVAQEALEFKKAQKELRDAINRRHLKTLETAITHGKESRFRDRLSGPLQEAEELRDHLVNLNRIAHDVLEMKQPTISELRSYTYPPPIIHEVMKATFLMLGEKELYTEDWDDLKVLMGRTGKNSMLRRVREFDTVHVQPETKTRVDELISPYNEWDVRQASAGAGTFYKWLQSVSDVLEEGRNRNDPA